MGKFWRGIAAVRLLLVPRYRYGRPGPMFTALEWIRTATTIAVVVVSLRFAGFSFEDRIVRGPLVSGLLAVPAVVLGMLTVLVAARPGHRRAALRALRRPAVTLVGALAAGYLFLRVVMYVGWHLGGISGHLLFLALVAFGCPALAVLSFLCLRYWFVAADGHPMLPALCALGYAGAQLVVLVAGGPSPDLPPGLRWLVGAGGPLTLAAIAAAELIAWRYRRGVSLRTLPPPVSPPRTERERLGIAAMSVDRTS
jgi:hypothetical protein